MQDTVTQDDRLGQQQGSDNALRTTSGCSNWSCLALMPMLLLSDCHAGPHDDI